MKLELRRVTLAATGVHSARRAWPERESVLLRCTAPDGEVGIGEASPLPGYSRDELDHVESALHELEPAAIATALEQPSLRAALYALGRLVSESLPSARMALETAGLDLLGQRRGLSAAALLGAPAEGRRRLAALVGPAGATTLPGSCERALREGFQHLKLKLGEVGRLEAELDAVVALRARLGPEISLRLDANSSLNAAEVAQAWTRLSSLELELFEEPGEIPESLAGALPLGLDESLQGLREAEAEGLLRLRQARCLVLKPMALGGIEHCLRLAERARNAGASVVVSHCFDGPFAWRAAAALALSLPSGAAHGLAPHAGLTAWRPAPLPVRDGWLESWSEPGLGAPAPHGFT
jgi:L-alanine-DL-glutamate epimerase-like enolase superfamily enzyme